MPRWEDVLSLIANSVEERFDALKFGLSKRLNSHKPICIVPYRSYGTSERLYVHARVLANHRVRSARDSDSTWDNLLNMYRRFESDEIPHARVLAHYGGMTHELVADDGGFIRAWLPTHPGAPQVRPTMPPGEKTTKVVRRAVAGPGQAGQAGAAEIEPALEAVDSIWRPVTLELLDPPPPDGQPVRETSFVLVPPPSARYIVISDIDDTVIKTNVAHFIRMARTVFLGNARLRLPFEGVGAFYRALYQGASGQERNPMLYVSNSPWNLYDLFSDFFQMQDIPVGPVLILRDWGISRDRSDFAPLHARAFKTAAIRSILDVYPDLPFILIGDSGEKDPEIYQDIVSQAPGRVLAVYIRNISRKPKRRKAIEALAAKVIEAGSTLILADSTLPLAEHAAQQGWIAPASLPLIREAKAADEAPPTPLEKLLSEEAPEPGPTVVVDGQAPVEPAIDEALEQSDTSTKKPPTVVVEGKAGRDKPDPVSGHSTRNPSKGSRRR